METLRVVESREVVGVNLEAVRPPESVLKQGRN